MAREKEEKNQLTFEQLNAAIALAELGLKQHFQFRFKVKEALEYIGLDKCPSINDEEIAKAFIIMCCYEFFGRSDFRTNCILVSLGLADGYTSADSGAARRRKFAEQNGQTEAKIRKAYQEHLKELVFMLSIFINTGVGEEYVCSLLEKARYKNILLEDEYGNKLQLPTLG